MWIVSPVHTCRVDAWLKFEYWGEVHEIMQGTLGWR